MEVNDNDTVLDENSPRELSTMPTFVSSSSSSSAENRRNGLLIYTRNGTVLVNTLSKDEYDIHHLIMLLLSFQQLSCYSSSTHLELELKSGGDKIHVFTTDSNNIVCSLFGPNYDDQLAFKSYCICALFTVIFRSKLLKHVREKVLLAEKSRELAASQYQYKYNRDHDSSYTELKDFNNLILSDIQNCFSLFLECDLVLPLLSSSEDDNNSPPFLHIWIHDLYSLDIGCLSLFDTKHNEWTQFHWENQNLSSNIVSRLVHLRDFKHLESKHLIRYHLEKYGNNLHHLKTESDEIIDLLSSATYYLGENCKLVMATLGRYVLVLFSHRSIHDTYQNGPSVQQACVVNPIDKNILYFEEAVSPSFDSSLHNLAKGIMIDIYCFSALILADLEDQSEWYRNKYIDFTIERMAAYQFDVIPKRCPPTESDAQPKSSQQKFSPTPPSNPKKDIGRRTRIKQDIDQPLAEHHGGTDEKQVVAPAPPPVVIAESNGGRRSILKKRMDRIQRENTLDKNIQDVMQSSDEGSLKMEKPAPESGRANQLVTASRATSARGLVDILQLESFERKLKHGEKPALVNPDNLYI